MIYDALVMDNSQFFSSGKIRVRVANFFMNKMTWDLSTDVAQIKNARKEGGGHYDFDAYVFSTIGGGDNFGMFFLPQINTKGFVAFTGNPLQAGTRCFWLGSIFEPVFQNDGVSLSKIKMPSDIVAEESNGFEGIRNFNVENGALVIRLKSTSLGDNPTTPVSNNLNWSNRKTENLLVMNKEKFLLHHNTYKVDNDGKQTKIGHQEILLSDGITKIETITCNNKNGCERKATYTINNKCLGIEHQFLTTNQSCKKEENNCSIFSLGSDGFKIETCFKDTCNKDIISCISQGKTNLCLSYGKNGIEMNSQGINMFAPENKLYITACEIHLGAGDNRVVTTTQKNRFNVVDKQLFSVSETIFG